MPRKLALKRLKASDLSFFQSYLELHPSAKQKGFNLDRAVFEEVLFPSLTAEIEATAEKRAGVALTFFGPGAAPAHLLMRKVLKQQKNWRLNGEVVHNPADEPTRFDIVAPEDFAVMEFMGAGLPTAARIVLLSATHPLDSATHAAFAAMFPQDSMSVLSEDDIEKAIATAATPSDHPIRDWLDRDLLEEVALGDGAAVDRLRARRRTRGVTALELRKAKAAAEAVGRLGEELLNSYFTEASRDEIASHEWTANVDAVSPFDFLVRRPDDSVFHADAKSTGGPFSNTIHLSLGEIRHALGSGVPYCIYRLYEVRESGAKLRIARDIGGRLNNVAEALRRLPEGVTADSLSFDPDYFDFEPTEHTIAFADDGG